MNRGLPARQRSYSNDLHPERHVLPPRGILIRSPYPRGERQLWRVRFSKDVVKRAREVERQALLKKRVRREEKYSLLRAVAVSSVAVSASFGYLLFCWLWGGGILPSSDLNSHALNSTDAYGWCPARRVDDAPAGTSECHKSVVLAACAVVLLYAALWDCATKWPQQPERRKAMRAKKAEPTPSLESGPAC